MCIDLPRRQATELGTYVAQRDGLDTREERPFDLDSVENGGYRYTTNQPLSSIIAIERQTAEVLRAFDFAGKSVIDVGCGDGGITTELYDRGRPSRITGVDPAANAIAIGQTRIGGRPIEMSVASAYDLPFADQSFDVAHLRGVLHHMDTPNVAVKEAARVARTVVILEPNGYNPVLKLIETVSSYHKAHGERSFSSTTIDTWMRDAGLTITYKSFCCLVPYFCPDGIARVLKQLEPLVEAIPLVNRFGCGAYVVTGGR